MTLSCALMLIGLKHTGKSTVGRLLAQKAECPFYDLDDCIRVVWESRNPPLSVREIYAAVGPDGFADAEEEAALLLRDKLASSSAVAALGGGTPENEAAMRVLKGAGRFVLIEEDWDVLYKRVMKGGLPAFLSPLRPYEDFIALCERRAPLYKRYADVVLTPKGGNAESVCQTLIHELARTGYAR